MSCFRNAMIAGRPFGGGRFFRGLLWGGGLLTLTLSLLLRNPLLLQWRPTATLLVIGSTIASLSYMGLKFRLTFDQLRQQGALLALWLCVLVITVVQESNYLSHKHNVLSSIDTNAQMLGAHMIVGYSDPKAVKILVEKGLVGGIFITAHNVKGRSSESIMAEISTLQTLRKIAGLPPLIVSTDQEGGIVSRMSPPLSQLPPLAEVIAEARPDQIESLAFAYGEKQGRELSAVGVNVNFAPLADLSSSSERHQFDFRSMIGRRAIDADPGRVSSAVIGYAHGLESSGVHATLKHFPGLGRVTADTHIFPAILSASESDLETSDWIPFHEGLRATQSLLMVGHATLSAVDATKPASRSAKVIQEIVRKRWHHDGVLVTDDLTMGAVVVQGLCSSGVDAINAGIDLLLVSYDADQYYEIFDCLLQASQRKQLDNKVLESSQRRLGRLLAALHHEPLAHPSTRTGAIKPRQPVMSNVKPQYRTV
jgi:beta-N-acetylhexosaminidase